MSHAKDLSRSICAFLCCAATFVMLAGSISAVAETTTTTTTVTHPDGSTTTTVEETTTEQAPQPQNDPKLIGPTGATGVIRRSDRRQDRRAGNPRID